MNREVYTEYKLKAVFLAIYIYMVQWNTRIDSPYDEVTDITETKTLLYVARLLMLPKTFKCKVLRINSRH